jgi:hypothetical protein
VPPSPTRAEAIALSEAVATYEAEMHMMCICHAAGSDPRACRPASIQPLCQTLTQGYPGGHGVAQALLHAHSELMSAINASPPGTRSERVRERRENLVNGLGLVRHVFLAAAA